MLKDDVISIPKCGWPSYMYMYVHVLSMHVYMYVREQVAQRNTCIGYNVCVYSVLVYVCTCTRVGVRGGVYGVLFQRRRIAVLRPRNMCPIHCGILWYSIRAAFPAEKNVCI